MSRTAPDHAGCARATGADGWLLLLRHAETEGGEGRCIGRTPLELSARGREQAEELAGALEALRPARLCSSPARRALDTAAPLAQRMGLGVVAVPGLDELDMGQWDGLEFDDIRARWPQAYADRGLRFATFRPPGGESFADAADRACDALRDLAQGPLPVVAVTHAGVIRAVLCRLTGHSLDDPFHFRPGYARCAALCVYGKRIVPVAADLDPAHVLTMP